MRGRAGAGSGTRHAERGPEPQARLCGRNAVAETQCPPHRDAPCARRHGQVIGLKMKRIFATGGASQNADICQARPALEPPSRRRCPTGPRLAVRLSPSPNVRGDFMQVLTGAIHNSSGHPGTKRVPSASTRTNFNFHLRAGDRRCLRRGGLHAARSRRGGHRRRVPVRRGHQLVPRATCAAASPPSSLNHCAHFKTDFVCAALRFVCAAQCTRSSARRQASSFRLPTLWLPPRVRAPTHAKHSEQACTPRAPLAIANHHTRSAWLWTAGPDAEPHVSLAASPRAEAAAVYDGMMEHFAAMEKKTIEDAQ